MTWHIERDHIKQKYCLTAYASKRKLYIGCHKNTAEGDIMEEKMMMYDLCNKKQHYYTTKKALFSTAGVLYSPAELLFCDSCTFRTNHWDEEPCHSCSVRFPTGWRQEEKG